MNKELFKEKKILCRNVTFWKMCSPENGPQSIIRQLILDGVLYCWNNLATKMEIEA